MRGICSLFIQIWCLMSVTIRNFPLLCNFNFCILSFLYFDDNFDNICCLLCNSPSWTLLFLLFSTIVQMWIHKLPYRLHFSDFFFIFLQAFIIHLHFFLKIHAQNGREFPSVDVRTSEYYRVIHFLFYKPYYSITWLNICFSKRYKMFILTSYFFWRSVIYLLDVHPAFIYFNSAA